jgi:hypothetical protein
MDWLAEYVAHLINGDVVFTTEFGVMIGDNTVEIVNAVRKALDERKRLYVYSEDEIALRGIMELLNEDLKRLSPFKKMREA